MINGLGGASIAQLLHVPGHLSKKLKARESNFLIRGRWCIHRNFKVAFPVVANQIECVVPYSRGDSLVWITSVTGQVSFKDVYEV